MTVVKLFPDSQIGKSQYQRFQDAKDDLVYLERLALERKDWQMLKHLSASIYMVDRAFAVYREDYVV